LPEQNKYLLGDRFPPNALVNYFFGPFVNFPNLQFKVLNSKIKCCNIVKGGGLSSQEGTGTMRSQYDTVGEFALSGIRLMNYFYFYSIDRDAKAIHRI
jgi:hypothetical protein